MWKIGSPDSKKEQIFNGVKRHLNNAPILQKDSKDYHGSNPSEVVV